MRALVVGGSGSGKSAYAERLACSLANTRTYVATMRPEGREARERIARHRAQRAHKNFATLERTDSLLPLPTPHATAGVALVEDLGNLVANALFKKDGAMADPGQVHERLQRELDALAHAFEHVVVVGNEVGSEGMPQHPTTLAWVRLQGALCCSIAATFDTVVEVTAGMPHVVKGVVA